TIVALKGQGISSLIGTSNPKAIGDFIKLNGLKNDVIQEGREYRLPTGENLGNNAALGQAALNMSNAKLAQQAATRAAAADAAAKAASTQVASGDSTPPLLRRPEAVAASPAIAIQSSVPVAKTELQLARESHNQYYESMMDRGAAKSNPLTYFGGLLGKKVGDFVYGGIDNAIAEQKQFVANPLDYGVNKVVTFAKNKVGDAEIVLNIGSNLLGTIAGGLTGSFVGVVTQDSAAGNAVLDGVRDTFTIQVKTEAGKQRAQQLGEALAPVGQAFKYLEQTSGDFGYDAFGGSP
ncbi:MAG: hypothetical protein K0Q74_1683, partial [Gammaproteobacteria bacterium]|nr:hypothetical protein [Gammaproteobacteria bacterium]